ncbi:hypothetical protein RRG08_055770 [Elysia crispata]|uniref:Uncharacterized protein n=1 Tax=Elysia crispata TaxID=231223 RepID=A0AAE1E495_9GAST|nr:hypothetical protein RRG08_055770 [Elysia crispata]
MGDGHSITARMWNRSFSGGCPGLIGERREVRERGEESGAETSVMGTASAGQGMSPWNRVFLWSVGTGLGLSLVGVLVYGETSDWVSRLIGGVGERERGDINDGHSITARMEEERGKADKPRGEGWGDTVKGSTRASLTGWNSLVGVLV